jgi:hypothetical protein
LAERRIALEHIEAYFSIAMLVFQTAPSLERIIKEQLSAQPNKKRSKSISWHKAT